MRKTKLIALTLVVAIMMVGAGYAAWSDTLLVKQEVNTGHLDVHFVNIENEVEVAVQDEPNMNGKVKYELDSEGGQNDKDRAIITITDAYPGSEYTVKLRMKNNSTMPVKLTNPVLPANPWQMGGSLPLTWMNMSDLKVYINESNTAYSFDHDIPKDATIDWEFNVRIPYEGDETTVKEDNLYTFWFKPLFIQFNED